MNYDYRETVFWKLSPYIVSCYEIWLFSIFLFFWGGGTQTFRKQILHVAFMKVPMSKISENVFFIALL